MAKHKDEISQLWKMVEALQQRVADLAKQQKSPNMSRLEHRWTRAKLLASLGPLDNVKAKLLSPSGIVLNYEIDVYEVHGKLARKDQIVDIRWHQAIEGEGGYRWAAMGLTDIQRATAFGDISATGSASVKVFTGEGEDIELQIDAEMVLDPGDEPIASGAPVYIAWVNDWDTGLMRWEIIQRECA